MKHKEIAEYLIALGPSEQKIVVNNLLEHLGSIETSVIESRQDQITKTGLIKLKKG